MFSFKNLGSVTSLRKADAMAQYDAYHIGGRRDLSENHTMNASRYKSKTPAAVQATFAIP
jgi:hypothetical protein